MLTFGSLFTGIGGFAPCEDYNLAFEQAGICCAWQCDLYRPAPWLAIYQPQLAGGAVIIASADPALAPGALVPLSHSAA